MFNLLGVEVIECYRKPVDSYGADELYKQYINYKLITSSDVVPALAWFKSRMMILLLCGCKAVNSSN